jgi:hypothetical protein
MKPGLKPLADRRNWRVTAHNFGQFARISELN